MTRTVDFLDPARVRNAFITNAATKHGSASASTVYSVELLQEPFPPLLLFCGTSYRLQLSLLPPEVLL